MATVVATRTTPAPVGEQRVLLRGVGWKGYEALLEMVGDGHVRLACDGKDVELMSPSYDHEHFKKLLARLIEMLTFELRIPCKCAGSTTWRKPLVGRGLEPDECYYLADTVRLIGRTIDQTVDPPPDLAAEVEISRSALDRMGIYAALRVPEVWRFDGERLTVACLQADGTYATVDASPAFPFLPPGEVVRWLAMGADMDETEWLHQFCEWIRAELLPRHEGR